MHDRKMDTLSISIRALTEAVSRLESIHEEGYTNHIAISLPDELGRLQKALKRVKDEQQEELKKNEKKACYDSMRVVNSGVFYKEVK